MYGPDISDAGDVTSSALNASQDFPDSSMGSFHEMSLMEGQIQEVYAIDDSRNDESSLPGQVTVYDVLARTPDGGTEVLRKCRALQPFWGGTLNNYQEVLPPTPGQQAKEGINSKLKKGTMVLVGFVSGQRNSPVILGSLPHYNKTAVAKRPSKSKGTYLETEFQGLNVQVSNEGAYTLTFHGPRNDSGGTVNSNGPTQFKIDQNGNISFTTNKSQAVTINRQSQTTTIKNGSTTLTIKNDSVTVNTTNATVNASGKVDVKAGGNANVKAGGDMVASAGGKIQADASSIELNGAGGQILTTATDPVVDLIFGVPTIGVPNVKAG